MINFDKCGKAKKKVKNCTSINKDNQVIDN